MADEVDPDWMDAQLGLGGGKKADPYSPPPAAAPLTSSPPRRGFLDKAAGISEDLTSLAFDPGNTLKRVYSDLPPEVTVPAEAVSNLAAAVPGMVYGAAENPAQFLQEQVLDPTEREYEKAYDSSLPWYSRAAHAVAGTIPVLGPGVAESSEVKPAYAGEPLHLQIERAAVGWVAGLLGGAELAKHLGGPEAARGRQVGRDLAADAGLPSPPIAPEAEILKPQRKAIPTPALQAFAETTREAAKNGEQLAPKATLLLQAAREELGERGEPLDYHKVQPQEVPEALTSLGWDTGRLQETDPAKAADALKAAGFEISEGGGPPEAPKLGSPEWDIAARKLEGPPAAESSLDDILGGVAAKEAAASAEAPPVADLSPEQLSRLDAEARTLVRAGGDEAVMLPYDTLVEHLAEEYGPQAHAAAQRVLNHVTDIYEGKEFQNVYDRVAAPAGLQQREPTATRDGVKQWVVPVDALGKEVSAAGDAGKVHALISWAEDPATGELRPAGGITNIRGEQHNLSHARSLGLHDLPTSFRPLREAADALGWKEAPAETSSSMALERYKTYNPTEGKGKGGSDVSGIAEETAAAAHENQRSPGEAREAPSQAGVPEAGAGEGPPRLGDAEAGRGARTTTPGSPPGPVPTEPAGLLDEAAGASTAGNGGGANQAGGGPPSSGGAGGSSAPKLGELPEETFADKVSRRFQDQTRRVATAEKTWQSQGATDRKVQSNFAGVRSKASYAQEIAEHKLVTPLIEELGKLRAPLEDLDDYAALLHKPTRDAVIAQRNPTITTGSGWSATAADARWRTLETAYGPRNAAGKIPALEPAMQHVRGMATAALDAAVEGGLLSADQVASLRQTWGEDYVPLRTYEAEQGVENRGAGSGTSGFSVKGKEYKAAFGRESRADSPTSHLVNQLMRTIDRAEKNKADQVFAKWITENGIAQLDPEHTKQAFDSKGQSVTVPDPMRAAQDFSFKVNGEAHRLDIASIDPLLDRALRNVGAQQLQGFVGQVATLTRRFSQLVTSYNPEFLFRNLARDLQDALINSGVEQGGGTAGSIAKEIFSTRALRESYRATKDPFHPEAQLFREFREDGGAIGWSQTKSPREIEAALRAKLSSTGPGVLQQGKRVFGAFVRFVEDANKSVENATRFAVYKALRDRGASRFDSGHTARNATLDFTKRGEAGPLLNAGYAFFNANVQGIKRLKEVAIDNPRGRKVAAGIIAAGATLDAYNRMHAGDANQDGTNDYDDIPEFVKQKNFILMRGEGRRPLMFPMPYGFSILNTLGRHAMGAWSGAEEPEKAALGVASAAWNAFNPLGGEAGLVQTLSPTVLDPFVQHATNETWTGRPLVPEPPEHGLAKPPSERFFKNAPPLAKAVAAALNKATGGDQITPGWISVSPEVLAHYTDAVNSYLTGGAGKFAVQVGQDISTLAHGEAPALRNIPIARSFAYEPSPAATGQKYKANLKELEDDDLRQRAYLKQGDQAGLDRIPPALPAVRRAVLAIDKQIKVLREQEAKGAGDLSEQIEELQTTANRLIADVRKGLQPPPAAPQLVASAGADEAPLGDADLEEMDRTLGLRK